MESNVPKAVSLSIQVHDKSSEEKFLKGTENEWHISSIKVHFSKTKEGK